MIPCPAVELSVLDHDPVGLFFIQPIIRSNHYFATVSMDFRPLTTTNELDAAIATSYDVPVVVFKHSRLCSLSSIAYREMASLTRADDPPVYLLVVQESRALSDAIEVDFAIRHESPQYIVLGSGKPLANASHRKVTADAIREIVNANVSG